MKKVYAFLMAAMVGSAAVSEANAAVVMNGASMASASVAVAGDEANDAAFEEMVMGIEGLQQQLTMALNTMNDEYEEAVVEEMTPAASAIAQQIQTLQTWAEESYNAGTAVADQEEIMSQFEGIQILITQMLNTAADLQEELNAKKANEAAFEEMVLGIEGLSQQLTMALNYMNGEYEEAVVEEMTPAASAIAQQIQTLQTWAEESYNAGTAVADQEEIMSQFEGIQILITQMLNTAADLQEELNAKKANEAAFEEMVLGIEGLSQQLTMALNYMNGEYEEAVVEEMTPAASAIAQQIQTLQTWAEESYNAGTAVADQEEIMSQFEQIQILITQMLNTAADLQKELEENRAANEAAFEEMVLGIEALQQQLTMALNTMNDEYDEEVVEQMTPAASAIAQNILNLQTWAEESYNAGTAAADQEEIMSQFEGIQILITQMLNTAADLQEEYDAEKAAANEKAFEEIVLAIQGLQNDLTKALQKLNNYDEEVVEEFSPVASAIAQNIDILYTWAEESYNAGTAVQDKEEIMGQFDQILTQIAQMLQSAEDRQAELDEQKAIDAANDKALAQVLAEVEALYAELDEAVQTLSNYEGDVQFDYLTTVNGIYENITALKTWAQESHASGTILDELAEILGSINPIKEQIAQLLNAATEEQEEIEETEAAEEANDKAYEQFTTEIEALQAQLAEALAKIEAEYDEEVAEAMMPAANEIAQAIAALQAKGEASHEAGNLAAELAQIFTGFGPVQEQIAQLLSDAADKQQAINEQKALDYVNNMAFEEATLAIEALQQQLTKAIKVIMGYEESVQEEFLPVANGIAQNIATLQTWAEESYMAGTMVADLEEIMAGIDPIKEQINQLLNAAAEAQQATGIKSINAKSVKDGKYVKGGKVVIVKNGKTYTANGARL